MLVVERQFPQFLFGVIAGLYRALISDPDVFLLGTSGLLLGASRRRLRGVGAALAAYVTFRRLDRYVDVTVQTVQHVSVMRQRQHTVDSYGV